MKRLVTVILLLATVGTHGAEVGRTSATPGNQPTTATPRTVILAAMKTYDVGCGTFQAPEDFEFKHTGTKDSFMGTLTRKSDGFTIHLDHCFGIRVSVPNKEKFAVFRVHTVGNNAAYTGIERANGKQSVATTVCDWCERGRQFVEESAAIRLLPSEQREEKYRDLNQRRAQFDKERPLPANFSADFTRDEDLLDFMLIVNSYTPSAGVASAQSLVGVTLPPGPTGLVDGKTGACVSYALGAGRDCEYSVGILVDSTGIPKFVYGARFKERDAEQKPIWTISDTYPYPSISAGQYLAMAMCRVGPTMDETIVAVVYDDKGKEWHDRVVSVRKLDINTGRFLDVPVGDVSCLSLASGDE